MTIAQTSQVFNQAAPNKLHVLLPLLILWHVTRLGEGEPFHLLDAMEEGCNDVILRLVVNAVDKEGRNVDLGDILENRPVFQGACDVEF